MSRQLASYDRIAPVYDLLSEVWSLGRIRAARLDQLNWLEPGEAVLFCGCGSGTEAIAAARQGCRVTAVDLSSGMIDRLRRGLQRADVSATVVHGRAEDIPAEPKFDAVCANFFLNIFPDSDMRSMLAHLGERVTPGGRLMIADVAPPQGSSAARLANRIYLHGAMLPFWAMRLLHWHANHDYAEALRSLGWKIATVQPFRVPPLGPVMYQNLVAVRAN
jgi:ubiquinone/menaquinone biosynthesis C-methylase UbiE